MVFLSRPRKICFGPEYFYPHGKTRPLVVKILQVQKYVFWDIKKFGSGCAWHHRLVPLLSTSGSRARTSARALQPAASARAAICYCDHDPREGPCMRMQRPRCMGGGARRNPLLFFRNRVPYEKLIYADPTIFVTPGFFIQLWPSEITGGISYYLL